MKRGFMSVFGVAVICAPALVVAQQTPAPPTVKAAPLPAVPFVPAVQSVSPNVTSPTVSGKPASATTPPTTPEVTVNIGGAPPPTGGLAPLPQVDLPVGMVVPQARTASNPLPPIAPLVKTAPAPPAKLTPAQIAQQIAPNFNITRDYVRLTQCYGIADFMGAVTRIQASRPGATPQIVAVARSIGGLQDAMQPMVLAASTVRGEARFRTDYDAIARNGQRELATSRTPNLTMQRRLATLDACRTDVARWRGGR
jgi:hypothetical protein